MTPITQHPDFTDNYDRTVYVDMDGVIVDFENGFKKLKNSLGMLATPFEDKFGSDAMWGVIEKHGKSKFFENLPWIEPGGIELWKFISSNFLNVKILTALGKSDLADKQTSTGKKGWLHRNIPSLDDKDVIMVPNKYAKKHWARPGDILIDDTDVCIIGWNKKGGIGILHKSTPETIRILEKYV